MTGVGHITQNREMMSCLGICKKNKKTLQVDVGLDGACVIPAFNFAGFRTSTTAYIVV